VATRQLVADTDLALLCHIDTHQFVDAWRQFVAVAAVVFLALQHVDVDDLAGLAVRHVERGVAHFAGLFTEDGAQQTLFGGEFGFALRAHLADEHVAWCHFCANADDAAIVEVGDDVFRQVRDVAGDFLRTELGVTRIDVVLLHVDGGENVFFHETLRDDDGVLVVVALPRHEGNEQVLAQRQFALVGARAVGEEVAFFHLLALVHARNLVDRGVLVGTTELDEVVLVVLLRQVVVAHDDAVTSDELDRAAVAGQHEVCSVACGAGLHTGTDEWRLGAHERHCLTLHVGTHQGAVGVVMLEERNQRGCNRHDLARRDVDEVNLLGSDEGQVGGRTEE